MINTPWETIFWCNWLFCLISFLYLIGMIFLFLLTLFYYTKKESTQQQIIGLFFMLNLVFIVTFLSFFGVIGIIEHFSQNDQTRLIQTCYIIIIWSLCKLIYVLYFSADIIKFIISIQKDANEDSDNSPDVTERKKQNIITRRKVDQNKFMVKQTSTFFTNSDLTKDLYLKMKYQSTKGIRSSLQFLNSSKKVNDEEKLKNQSQKQPDE